MRALFTVVLFILALGLPARARALTLYDAFAGLPSGQGWASLIAGSPGVESAAGGLYTLDTTGAGVDTHGHGRLSPVTLNTDTGFRVDFTLRIVGETHTSSNRAGYSMLFVGSNPAQSLELAFWGNEIFAYDYQAADPDRFVHGVGAALNTGLALRSYTLNVANQQFTLSTEGLVLFGGSLENYTPQGLPYTLPNFIFFGDNSSRGASSIELAQIGVTLVPELPTAWMAVAGLVVFRLWGYRAACRRGRSPRR